MARSDLQRLVDELPEALVHAAQKALEAVREAAGLGIPRSIQDAPEDEEALSAEDRAAVEEGWDDVRAGRVHSMEEVRRELGL